MPPSKGAKLVDANKPVSFQAQGEVHLPKLGTYVGVPIARLEKLMNRITANSRQHNYLENAGYALAGIGAGALVSALCLLASVDFSKNVNGTETINWKGFVLTSLVSLLGATCAGCGALSIWYHYDKKKSQETVYDHIIEDMDEIKKTCFPVELPTEGPRP